MRCQNLCMLYGSESAIIFTNFFWLSATNRLSPKVSFETWTWKEFFAKTFGIFVTYCDKMGPYFFWETKKLLICGQASILYWTYKLKFFLSHKKKISSPPLPIHFSNDFIIVMYWNFGVSKRWGNKTYKKNQQ